MIRDPSDGTVRETGITGQKPAIERGSSQGFLDKSASGLPTDRMKADEIARLEKSRDWLSERFRLKPKPESGEG